MSKTGSYFLWRWTIFAVGLMTIAFGSLYFFKASAQTENLEKTATEQPQNLVLGKLAFTSRRAGPTSPDGAVIVTNPDGSGGFSLGIPAELDAGQPAWSPDGTKIAWVGNQNLGDIFVTNLIAGGHTNLTNTANPARERNPSWSATGKIAYERDSKIWTMNADGSGQAEFSGITSPTAAAPAWSPDGTKLAFSNGDIWVINADGTNERRVTMSAATETEPSWSPDGAKLVFAKSGSGITVINLDGTGETPLTSTSNDAAPSWSPDGTKIAFRRGGIYTMNADGTNQVRIVADIIQFPLCCDIIYENPAWQPVVQPPNTFTINGRVTYNNLPVNGATVNLTGTTTASVTTDAVGNYQFSGLPAGGSYTVTPTLTNYLFTPQNRTFGNLASNQTGNFEVLAVCLANGRCVKNGRIAFVRGTDIFTVNPDGSNQLNLTNGTATNSEPNYSPSGASIAFSTNRDGNYEIYRMNADGSNPVRLTNNAASDTSPFYSPDGASIVFTSNRDGNSEIYKMNADGSNQLRLTNSALSEFDPAFSPDGQKIVFANNELMSRKLLTMNADGSNQQIVPGTETPIGGYSHPSYSPDGSKIIFTFTSDAGTQYRLTWTMNADGSNRVKFPADGRDGTFSPDGTKVVYSCCEFNFTNRIRTSNANGTGELIMTPSNSSNFLPAWQPIPLTRRTPFDYDGDGKSDISVFRPAENKWYILQSSNLAFRERAFGAAGDIPTPSDFDGDGRTDPAIFRPSAGDWWYLSSLSGNQVNVHFGQNGDIPRPSDFDGDGKTDFVVYRPSNNVWYRLGTTGQTTVTQFGAGGDQPIVGDFDGDGKSDLAVFRPSTGDWWYAASSLGGQHAVVHWGQAGDIPAPGDYDADGKTDFVVFRPSNGGWYILRTGEQNYTILSFGLPEDKPVAGDYDGDGKADVAVWRPSTGVWYLLQTTSGFGALQFGLAGDVPTENSFLP